MCVNRRTRSRLTAAAAALLVALPAAAEDVPVPAELQAELLFMIAGRDKNLAARAGDTVRTLIVTKPGEASSRAAAQLKAAAGRKEKIAGLAHEETTLAYSGAAALAEACKARKISVLYLTPGFTPEEAAAIGQALESGDVLSVSAAPALVRKGVVLGFDLVSGRAKLLVDLTRAAKQHVAFPPEVLGLMAVSQ
jgi:pyruvate-formate lyase-activating enzyme